jgi:hypothetical protein
MNKFTLLAAALSCTTLLTAQKGIEVGLNFTPTNVWILNSEDFAEDQDLDFKPKLGFNAGLTVGLNFTDGMGITSGISFIKNGQNYITGYDNVPKEDQDVFSRELSYMRVPVLFKFNGDISASSTSFFRVGPHFDFLQSARFKYDDKGLFNVDADIDMKDYKNVLGQSVELYKKTVIGLTLEMGGMVNISEAMKLVFMLHLSGSLTNPETENMPKQYLYPYAGSITSPTRSTAYNAAAGITIGFNYVIPMGKNN